MISYSQTVEQLFDLQKYAIKLGLENITLLSKNFGDPHLKYPTIHVAGTNGKGSTSFFISKILQTTGLKVGLFTSPHLVDFRERIRINDELIATEYVISFWQDVKELVLKLEATFFDTTTLLAFKYFSDRNVDVAIIETGLGGRLDSTNILKPEIAVLTPIAYDHQKQLGKTIEKIAYEKAGIIKDSSDVIIAEQELSVFDVFKSEANESNHIFYLPEIYKTIKSNLSIEGLKFEVENIKSGEKIKLDTPLPIEHQAQNISLSFLACSQYAEKYGKELNLEKIKSVITQSIWPGRLQLIEKSPNVFFDVSHNYNGIKSTVESLLKFLNLGKTDLLLGIVNDKDAQQIVKYLSGKFRYIIVTEPETHRRQDGNILTKIFKQEMQPVKFIKDLNTAYDESLKRLSKEDTLIAMGSHYLIGAIMERLK